MTPTSAGTATPRSSTATRMWPSWRRYAAGRWSCTTSIPGIAARPPWSPVGELRDDDYVVVFHPRDRRGPTFPVPRRLGARPEEGPLGRPRGCRARSPVPGDQRAQRLRGATAHRGHRRGARRSGVHQRGPDPQQRLQLVAHVCRRDHRQDRHRGSVATPPTASRTCRCGPPGRRWRTPRWVPSRSARLSSAPAPAPG